MPTRLMVPLISSVFQHQPKLEPHRRIRLPYPYDSSQSVLDDSSDQYFLRFGYRMSSNVTFLLLANVLPLDVLLLFRASELPLFRRISLADWLCDGFGEGARLSAQLMSNQVNPPGNEEAEVFVIVPATANIEGC